MKDFLFSAALAAMLLAMLAAGAINFRVVAVSQNQEGRAGLDSWVGDLSPIGQGDWSYDRAAHLLERAGFGGTPDEIKTLADMTPQEAVRRLVYFQNVKEAPLPPF